MPVFPSSPSLQTPFEMLQREKELADKLVQTKSGLAKKEKEYTELKEKADSEIKELAKKIEEEEKS